MRNQRIRTTPTVVGGHRQLKISGWLSGTQTYLWFGNERGDCIGILDGSKLYRLAKAIVARFEAQS